MDWKSDLDRIDMILARREMRADGDRCNAITRKLTEKITVSIPYEEKSVEYKEGIAQVFISTSTLKVEKL